MNAKSIRKFAWYNGDPKEYGKLLTGRCVQNAVGYGAFVDLYLDSDIYVSIGNGTNIRYYPPSEKTASKVLVIVRV